MKSFQTALSEAKNIAFLTGAGVSTPSGIPDFKSTDKLWPYKEPRESLLSLSSFHRNPERFWAVYREVFSSKFNATPNSVHQWIAELEKHKDVRVITQNVDGLHQKAGSSKVREVHGSNNNAFCRKCNSTVPMKDVMDIKLPRCEKCRKVLKPGVLLFQESVSDMDGAQEDIIKSDMLIVMGTSLETFPINLIPFYARAYTTMPIVWVNKDASPPNYVFDHKIQIELTEFVTIYSHGNES